MPDTSAEGRVAAQIRSDLGAALTWWVPLLGDDITDLIRQRIRDRAPGWAALVTAVNDPDSPGMVQDLMGVIDPPSDAWWGTPLGRVVAASTGSPLGEVVSHAVAAAMLGVHRSRVGQLVGDGRLDADPESGGVLVGSVLVELLRRDA